MVPLLGVNSKGSPLGRYIVLALTIVMELALSGMWVKVDGADSYVALTVGGVTLNSGFEDSCFLSKIVTLRNSTLLALRLASIS